MSEESHRIIADLQQQLSLVRASQEAYKALAEKYELAHKRSAEYKCYHCGNMFLGEHEARNHFGPRGDGSPTACLIETNRKLLEDNVRMLAMIGGK